MTMMTATSPNIYDVFIALIQMVGTAFAVYIAYRQTVANVGKVDQKVDGTHTKLDDVHRTVNGNLHAEKLRAEKYARKLWSLGVDPDTINPALPEEGE